MPYKDDATQALEDIAAELDRIYSDVNTEFDWRVMAKVIAAAISGAMSGDDWTDLVNDYLRNFALQSGFPLVPQLQWLDLEEEAARR